MEPIPLDPNQWHDAIVGKLTARQIAANIECERNAWYPTLLDATVPGDSLLELGCGTGVFSGILARHGRKTTLLDFSAESLDFCRQVYAQAGLQGDFVQADVCRPLPFADNSFDCVWSSGLLEHFTDEQLLFILKESARVARKTVVSLVPNAHAVFYRIGKWHQETHGLWAWGKEDPKHTLRGAFTRAGLRQVTEHTVDVRTAIAFLHTIQPAALRRMLVLVSKLLPPAGWRFLQQGYLLVTIGNKEPAVHGQAGRPPA